MPELVTIPSVPILRTGMAYPLASGPRTFAEEDLRAAAEAFATDPAVKAPRIKIDALARAWGLDPDAHGGEPAFGWFDRLTVTDNGQELVADAHVPEWLADAMQWAFPSLSIEGTPPGWESPTGRRHDLVITAVALLGTDWPGCTTLDDFRELLANGPIMEHPAEEVVLARTGPQVRASLDSDLVVRRFMERLDGDDVNLPDGVVAFDVWPRTMRFDDSGQPYLKATDEGSGRLYRIDFTVSGSDVTFGEFVEVVEQDQPVAASATRPTVVASWSSRAEVRAVASPTQEGIVPLDLAALRTRLGLPEDADEAAINEALSAESPQPDPQPDPGQPDPQPEPEPQPAAVPDGMVLIEKDKWAEVEEGLALAAKLGEEKRRADRAALVTAAIKEGRISVGNRGDWERRYDVEGHEATAQLIASLTPVVPVEARELGGAGDGDSPQDTDAGTGWFNFDTQGA